eukprot:14552949-Ditylum_brightwellii.AAC.1
MMNHHDALKYDGNIPMLVSQPGAGCVKKFLVQLHGFGKIFFLVIGLPSIVDSISNINVIIAKNHVSDAKRLNIGDQSIVIVAIHVMNSANVVECGGNITMLVSMDGMADSKQFQVQLHGFVGLCLGHVEVQNTNAVKSRSHVKVELVGGMVHHAESIGVGGHGIAVFSKV